LLIPHVIDVHNSVQKRWKTTL